MKHRKISVSHTYFEEHNPESVYVVQLIERLSGILLPTRMPVDISRSIIVSMSMREIHLWPTEFEPQDPWLSQI
jgi:hypothetical protein